MYGVRSFFPVITGFNFKYERQMELQVVYAELRQKQKSSWNDVDNEG